MDQYNFDKFFGRALMKLGLVWIIGVILTILLNLALLAGAVWVVIWVLRATGVLPT